MFSASRSYFQQVLPRGKDLRIRTWAQCLDIARSNGKDKLFAGVHLDDGTLDTKAFFRRGFRHLAFAAVLGLIAGSAYKINDNNEVAKQRAAYAGFVAVAEAAEKARLAAKAE